MLDGLVGTTTPLFELDGSPWREIREAWVVGCLVVAGRGECNVGVGMRVADEMLRVDSVA